MNKNIPYVKIERIKKDHQFYLDELPIHPDRLFPRLIDLKPDMIFIQVLKNEKLYWEAYYPITVKTDIEKLVWKAFRFKL